MSKDKGKTIDPELINKKKQELDEAYKELTVLETMKLAVGMDTGNQKYDALNKEFSELNVNDQGVIAGIVKIIGDGGSALQYSWEMAQVLPDLQAGYTNFKAIKSAASELEKTEAICKVIAEAGPLAAKVSSILHSETVTDKSKDYILDVAANRLVIPKATPILNKVFSKITKNFQISETEKINVLEGVNPVFTRETLKLGVDLLSPALNDKDLNPKMQEMYKNITQKNRSAIVQSAHDIINSDKMNPILVEKLPEFLKKPENQKALTQVAENVLNNKVTKIFAPELIKNTVELVTNSSEDLVKSAPSALRVFNKFTENQRWTSLNLNLEGLDTETKKALLAAKKPEVINLINNAKETIDNLAPVLEKELPKYLDDNKQNIADGLKPILIKKLESSKIEPELVNKAIDASLPFLKDAMPSISKLASAALSESDQVADIMQKAQLIKTLPKEEKTQELKELITSCVELKNKNPQVKQIIENDIPEILTKHSETLGPVVEDFLNKTPMGKKLKLDGEKLIEIAGKHTPELLKIADKFSKREYGKMILPTLKLLADPKVVGVIAESLVNLGKYKLKGKEKEVVGPHTAKLAQNKRNSKQASINR